MESFLNACDILTMTPHFTGKEVLASTKQKLNFSLGCFDSYSANKTNFLCLQAEMRSAKLQKTCEVVDKAMAEAKADVKIIANIENIAEAEDDNNLVALLQGLLYIMIIEESKCDITYSYIIWMPKYCFGSTCCAGRQSQRGSIR